MLNIPYTGAVYAAPYTFNTSLQLKNIVIIPDDGIICHAQRQRKIKVCNPPDPAIASWLANVS